MYFWDTGLVCSLLGIRSENELDLHYYKGHIFETFAVSEILKTNFHTGSRFDVYFWRDNHKKEIDLILESGGITYGIEIKSGKTIQPKFFDGLNYFTHFSNIKPEACCLIYGGRDNYRRNGFHVLGWESISRDGSIFFNMDD